MDTDRKAGTRIVRRFTLVAVRGESMRPALRYGDLLVASTRAGEPRLGEVVVIRAPMGVLVHRLVGLTRGPDGRAYYRTAGDANRRGDVFVVPGDAIIGVVRARLPGLGYPHVWGERILSSVSRHLRNVPSFRAFRIRRLRNGGRIR